MSVFVRVHPDQKNRDELTALGFVLKKGSGEKQYYIESRDSLLDPTARMYDIPWEHIVEVTIRADMECQIDQGVYETTLAKMLVLEKSEKYMAREGMFSVERTRVNSTYRIVRIRAATLQEAQAIVESAINDDNFVPDKNVGPAVIKAFAA